MRFTVDDLVNLTLDEQTCLNLRYLYKPKGPDREIVIPDINRPGLALAGYYENFGQNRIQLFGRGETAYLRKLEEERAFQSFEQFFSYNIPCLIFTHNLEPPPTFYSVARQSDHPILSTDLQTSEFSVRLTRVLSNIFAVRDTIHGVLLEVFGIGLVLKGDSGVGKSETALELLERGHRLVADDAIEIRRVAGNILVGSRINPELGYHMELRGLGIINIANLFGVGAIRNEKQVQMIVELEHWEPQKAYDRIGDVEQTNEIIGIDVPYILLPIMPGRNIPILIETAAMNERLKRMGYNAAKEFNRQVIEMMHRKKGQHND